MEDISFSNGNTNNNNKNNNKIIIVSVIAFVTVLIIVFAIVFSVDSGSSKRTINVSDTSISVSYLESLGYSAKINGVAKNNTGKNLSYASIEFSVYDSAGNNLGTALANINNLGDGDTWLFEATLFSFPSTKPATYKIADIIYW